jgi:DNA mismatch repair protein MutH
VASGASRKSLTKAFKEQGKTIKDLVQGVYQQKPHFQALAPDDYFEFDE